MADNNCGSDHTSENSGVRGETIKEESFNEILNFAKLAKYDIPSVVITAVELPELDVSKVKEIAKTIGVHFRARPYLNEYEEY